MNKEKMIEKVARDTKISRADVRTVAEALYREFVKELAKEGKCRFLGIGLFTVKKVPPHNFYNVKTGEMDVCKESTKISYKPSGSIVGYMESEGCDYG